MARPEGDPARIRALADLGERQGTELVTPPRLLSGEEVQRALGLPPGPEIGRALAAVEEAQVDGTIRNRDEALAILAAARPSPPLPFSAGRSSPRKGRKKRSS
jgi:hypothetical protein